MTASTIPAVGDPFEYNVIITRADRWYAHGTVAGHRDMGFRKPRECDPDNTRSCPQCFDQREKRTSTVVSVDYYMDNSIEVRLADGTRREVAPPSGDACY